jgi:hypothetical protein
MRITRKGRGLIERTDLMAGEAERAKAVEDLERIEAELKDIAGRLRALHAPAALMVKLEGDPYCGEEGVLDHLGEYIGEIAETLR